MTHRYLNQFALGSDVDLMRVLRALVAEMQAMMSWSIRPSGTPRYGRGVRLIASQLQS